MVVHAVVHTSEWVASVPDGIDGNRRVTSGPHRMSGGQVGHSIATHSWYSNVAPLY
jgi:hypothetical protein